MQGMPFVTGGNVVGDLTPTIEALAMHEISVQNLNVYIVYWAIDCVVIIRMWNKRVRRVTCFVFISKIASKETPNHFTKWLPPWRKGRISCLWIKSVFDCLTIGIIHETMVVHMTWVWTFFNNYIYIYIYIYIYMCVCVCVYIYVCIYIYIALK